LLQRRRSSPRCARPRPQAPPARVLVAERARIFSSRSAVVSRVSGFFVVVLPRRAVRRFPVSSSRSAPPGRFHSFNHARALSSRLRSVSPIPRRRGGFGFLPQQSLPARFSSPALGFVSPEARRQRRSSFHALPCRAASRALGFLRAGSGEPLSCSCLGRSSVFGQTLSRFAVLCCRRCAGDVFFSVDGSSPRA
jgi:hypothetical protein